MTAQAGQAETCCAAASLCPLPRQAQQPFPYVPQGNAAHTMLIRICPVPGSVQVQDGWDLMPPLFRLMPSSPGSGLSDWYKPLPTHRAVPVAPAAVRRSRAAPDPSQGSSSQGCPHFLGENQAPLALP